MYESYIRVVFSSGAQSADRFEDRRMRDGILTWQVVRTPEGSIHEDDVCLHVGDPFSDRIVSDLFQGVGPVVVIRQMEQRAIWPAQQEGVRIAPLVSMWDFYRHH